MTAPKRVQLRRTKGWRMPENTVKVARPTKWGNPFKVGGYYYYEDGVPVATGHASAGARVEDRDHAVHLFEELTELDGYEWGCVRDVRELRGKNLACFCPLTDAQGNHVPCHADVLLDLANKEPGA